MSTSKWSKVDFQEFVDEFGIDSIIKFAPTILYSKKDKEHEAFTSLVALFLVSGGLFIYIALAIIFADIYFSILLMIIIIIAAAVVDVVFLLNYLKSNVRIRPLECWIEIFKGAKKEGFEYFCFTYYPVFSGKCHPNKAFNLIYKVYQEEILKSTIDITQIEVYLKIKSGTPLEIEPIGLFFQYGEGKSFIDEKINRNAWKFFSYNKFSGDNYLAIANWEHQFEWKNDLALDFDKLHNYAAWVIQRWNKMNLKPLNDDFKYKMKFDKRYIEDLPKLHPWMEDLTDKTYINPLANKDLDIVNEAIKNVIGEDYRVEKLRDIKEDLFKIQAYFRDLNS
ncbi:MAG: hypothetical protein ACTSR8_08905 [Promethearchaeota archaeon]